MREKSKGGRPGLGTEKKTHNLFVGFSETEYELLNRKATAAGLKVQDFIRMTADKGYVSNIDTPEQHEVKRRLIGLSNHVNQLLKLAHINGLKTMHQKAEQKQAVVICHSENIRVPHSYSDQKGIERMKADFINQAQTYRYFSKEKGYIGEIQSYWIKKNTPTGIWR